MHYAMIIIEGKRMFDSDDLRDHDQCRHDLEVNGGKGLIVDPRTKYVYHRP